ncbi:HTTM domain-containing protein [bacterium]|nr:HTTM domain-containing protein [bacterium]
MKVFSLDLRAIALARMAIGLMILLDLFIRCQDIGAFYLPDGITPVASMPSSPNTFKHLELYRHLESWWEVAGVMGLAAVVAVLFTVGFYSRTTGLISWYLLASIQNRNLFVNDGGDLTLKLFLFIGLFLPLGARWSVDALRNPHWRKLPNQYLSPASAAMVLQFCVLYFAAGILKSDPVWRQTGDAIWMTLNIDQFSTGFARALLPHTTLLRILTFWVLAIELTTPLLLLCPVVNSWTRSLNLVLLIGLHLGIASCMHLGLFMPICLTVQVFLWPTPWMDFIEGQLLKFKDSAEQGEGPPPSGYRPSVLNKLASASIIVFIFVQNTYTITELNLGQPRGMVREVVMDYGRSTGMMQNWTLFAPKPNPQDGWFVVEGIRPDGQILDLMTGKPATYEKPQPVSAQFKNQRWRRIYQNLWQRWNPQHVPMFLRYMGRKWNREHPDLPVTSLRLIFIQEMTELPGVPVHTIPGTLGEFPSPWLEGERL